MSFYDNDHSWSAPGRQPSWEQQPPPSRSGTGSAASQQGEPNAFASQFEEIDRATDNLMRSGKWFPGQMPGVPMPPMPGRRDSMPSGGRGFEGFTSGDPRMGGSPRHSASEYEGGRPGSAGLQGYYAGQRFPGGRQSEAEQMLQAKRRMAAQRERELRNYHQEQQYNRTSVSGVKTDRSMSPNTMSEEDRRELIARQHRALYGDSSSIYPSEGGSASRPQSQDVRDPGAGGRGPSPLAFDPYGVQAQAGAEGAVQMPPRDRPESAASPASGGQSAQQSFGLLSQSQQNHRASSSSPGGSPPLVEGQKGANAGVAPIGTRPSQPPTAAGGLNKRATTPLTPSSLSYGYTSQDAQNTKDERSTSAASNPPLADKGVSGLGSWGGNSWGAGKSTLAIQPSSAPRPSNPVDSPASTGATTARPTSPKPPGGPATALRRRAAADRADKVANARPASTRAAGAGGSSSTMLRLYTDESPGLKVDPFVVMVLSLGFIISVVALHIIAKLTKRFSS
ncbi:hypothetical protein BAUCODRAFT_65481 [Baudoinia panamericana UAMH 10762]|uniref:Protein transport protein Sec61 subunit beta n=1 Tax=Baudoinia panamericana (strain UAMH 10762) TaxID=717646 RepID=M2LVD2_BAUPA|nr:uncharacterized protein BAUCODRAFT_65481 [Baudoinia panamericana UAMH 10762]EMC98582.1 hypothetical protein BAUCODRAFT_65481 [Baudoinia panamericana UAMH 10762]